MRVGKQISIYCTIEGFGGGIATDLAEENLSESLLSYFSNFVYN